MDTAAELGPVAQVIHDKLVANAATFPGLPTSVASLQTLITTHGQRLTARATRAVADQLAFTVAHNDLEAALHDLGIYVNLIAKGDPVIVKKSGFPSYTTVSTPLPAVPGAPQNLRLRQGDNTGVVRARCKPDRSPSTNIAQINSGDPNNEAGWGHPVTFTGGKVDLHGLTVGNTVWVRIATVGVGGVVGPWCDPGKIVVT